VPPREAIDLALDEGLVGAAVDVAHTRYGNATPAAARTTRASTLSTFPPRPNVRDDAHAHVRPTRTRFSVARLARFRAAYRPRGVALKEMAMRPSR
jgi:hypothetical protein